MAMDAAVFPCVKCDSTASGVISTEKKTMSTEGGAEEKDDGKEVFHDPETGEVISKSAYKKLMKNGGKKVEKKEKVVFAKVGEGKSKEKKKEKEPEQVFVDNTPSGDKKILGVFPPTYQPVYVESAWQAWWEKCGFYSPDVTKALNSPYENKFVMVIPPPNVTGSLHLGHALTSAIEDTITRYNRMKGKVTLWVPGTDHAGIATQSVVEKRLKKEFNLTRRDLGREEFVNRVWEWKTTYGGKICNQIRCLGSSVDWSREAFTMDEKLSKAVIEAFVRFHEDGLLYRDKRLINWSCALQSAISDIEVDHVDLEAIEYFPVPNHKLRPTYEFGTLTSFAYKVDGSDEEIVVATTRLETMLGDTGVAVHPNDPRYTHLHGKFVVHPFVDRKIPIICDDILVDMTFGTGAVKITPAHDHNDYACGKRHNLDFITILTEDGKISGNCGKYSGMMRYDARYEMESELKSLGLFRGKVPNKMRLGKCSRSGDIIEPMLSPQWYVNCTSMAARAVDAVRNGELKILPEMHEATWYRWLENIRDWCVSRQLWWGHRIPAYFVRLAGEERVDRNDDTHNNRWIVARTEADALQQAAVKFNVAPSAITLEQDEDVLDTWFSSGLFPWSVFGWPDNTVDFKAFYPTHLLETGLDILFFWVARMVMMGLQLTDTLPFRQVYLHPMVRDKNGRKMSKSLGNVIDPLEVINGCALTDLLKKIDEGNLPAKEVQTAKDAQTADFPDGIPQCGADALRFGLLAYTTQGRDINLDIKRVVGYRQFCNKLWNAVKFALTYLNDFIPSATMFTDVLEDVSISGRDKWILSKLNNIIKDCNIYIDNYNFGATALSLYSFFLYEVCDYYLELVKPVMYDTDAANQARKRCAQVTLYTVIEHYLRLCHPLMPFVTEELWQRLPNREHLTTVPSIMISAYPSAVPTAFNPVVEEQMELIKEMIASARSLRADYNVTSSSVKTNFYYRSDSPEVIAAINVFEMDFCTLAKGNYLKLLNPIGEAPKGCCIRVINDRVTLFIDLSGIIDIDGEISRLEKEKERISGAFEQFKRKVSAPGYDKVPENVKLLNAEKLNSYEQELEKTLAAIQSFESMKL